MKTYNSFYSVGSVTIVVALLLIQGATISATGGRVSSTIHSHGYNVNSNTSRAYSENVTYPNNERDMDVVSAASDRDDITWWQQDAQGNPAVPTAPIDAPDVTITYRVYLPLIKKNTGPPAGAPILNAINDPTGYYQYTLSWSAVERATSYTLQEDDNASFTSPASVYIGPSAATLVYAPSVGTYYYRVNASNVFGESGWSNTQSVVVSVPPLARPVSGHWSGTTNPGKPMSFNVSEDGTQWMSFTLSADWSGCEAYGTRTWTKTGPGSITNNQFSYTTAGVSFTGRFSSRTSASGTYHIDVSIPVVLCGPNGCSTCYVFFDEQSIWTATGP